jgi:hypothetical protein
VLRGAGACSRTWAWWCGWAPAQWTGCTDNLFSGHATLAVFCALLFWTYAGARRLWLRVYAATHVTATVGVIALTRLHYTVDILLALFFCVCVFAIYHMATSRSSYRVGRCSSGRGRGEGRAPSGRCGSAGGVPGPPAAGSRQRRWVRLPPSIAGSSEADAFDVAAYAASLRRGATDTVAVRAGQQDPILLGRCVSWRAPSRCYTALVVWMDGLDLAFAETDQAMGWRQAYVT